MKTILLLISDQNMSLLIGLGTGITGLLTIAIPLIFKFLAGQQELKKELLHNTKMTVEAGNKIDIANDITGKLLTSNNNIAQNQIDITANRKDIRRLEETAATRKE